MSGNLIRYLRFNVFQFLLRPFSRRMRGRRMESFMRLANVEAHMKILDLGGEPGIWSHVRTPLEITILNLPGKLNEAEESHHEFRYLEGDACHVEKLEDDRFDLVFSNSVIEHVGPESRRKAFASEVRRLGRAYWIQTPAKWFPIEAHSGMPFWWFYPDLLRSAFLRGWQKKLPAWTEAIRQTRVLERRELQGLFPGSRIHVERLFGIPKSYVAYVAAEPGRRG